MTDNHLTPEQLSQEQQYKAILEKTTYTLSHSEYNELSHIAALYESLHTLLEPFDNESPVSNISCLFNHLNDSFFGYIETLQPNNDNCDTVARSDSERSA